MLYFVCSSEGDRDSHGSWGGTWREALCQGGCVEQLLHATAHAEWLPAMDTLLLPPSLPQSKCKSKCFLSSTSKAAFSSVHWINEMTSHTFVIGPRGSCWLWYLSTQIAEEPPPLREIPPDCSPHTAEVIKLGLQRETSRRTSAKDLRVQTAKALKQRKPTHIRTFYTSTTDYI